MLEKEEESLYPKQYDVKNCDDEPISLIRRLQSYASLLVLTLDHSDWLYATRDLLEHIENHGLSKVLRSFDIDGVQRLKDKESLICSTILGPKRVIKYESDSFLTLELEDLEKQGAPVDVYQNSILKLSEKDDLDELLTAILSEIRSITGYDHAMIYQFDNELHGQVIRESKTLERPSYLNLKFPATDIPEPARKLYFIELIRTIADVGSEQKIIYKNGKYSELGELSLENVHSRGVSPIHLEYLSNMKVSASFSVAIIKNNHLWGLIACHHTRPSLISYEKRKWLKFLSKLISINLEKSDLVLQTNSSLVGALKIKNLVAKLNETNDFINSLLEVSEDLFEIFAVRGMIVKSGSVIKSEGVDSNDEKLIHLFEWLDAIDPFDVISSERSQDIIPPKAYSDNWAGILILQVSNSSQDYIIFTRPEEAKEVTWAGNPNKTKFFDEEKNRMSPRKSFAKWKDEVRGNSKPWSKTHLEAAHTIKAQIRELLYKKYDEVILLNKELQLAYQSMERFSYTVSHDLKAPLRSIEGFSKLLMNQYGRNLDKEGMHLLSLMMENVALMNQYIRDILQYSKFSFKQLDVRKINLTEFTRKVWRSIVTGSEDAVLAMSDSDLLVYGDEKLIMQIFLNLISNSIKYVQKGEIPKISISFKQQQDFVEVVISDNGIGIPIGKEERIFDLFKRYVKEDEYEGTGIGLATVRNAVEKHGGSISAWRNKEIGSTFSFTLPLTDSFFRVKKSIN